MFYTFATIRYYSDRGTSVVRTLRPNLVASSLLIPNFSLADQVLDIFCTSFSILFFMTQGTYVCKPEHSTSRFALRRLIFRSSGEIHRVRKFWEFSAFFRLSGSYCFLDLFAGSSGFSLHSQFVGGGGNRSGTNGSQYQTQDAPKPLLYLLVVLASWNCIFPLSRLQ